MPTYLDLNGLGRVAEKVNTKLNKVTSMPISPNLNDIVLYNGPTTQDYIQGDIYLYTIVTTYYQWTDLTNTYYTKSATPEVGDIVYSDTIGTDSGYTVENYDSTNNQIQINDLVYDRNSSGDTNINGWISKGGGISVILNGDRSENEANFYAPLTSGTAGQALISNGSDRAPSWVNSAGYNPSFIDDSLYFGVGSIPEVEGTSLILNI